MTSPQFIEWLERKLLANGVRKIVPEPKLLATVYTGMAKGNQLKAAFNKLKKDKSEIKVPKDLQRRVRKYLKERPQERWEEAVSAIVAGACAMTDITKQSRLTRKFVEWQREYAAKNIATFPVLITPEGKKPLVRHYQRIGLPASAQIARRFADAPGIGFMAGPRNSVTVLDIDEAGDKPLHKALDRHGETPIIVRTASGKFHAWYRHNGERRSVRPEPGNEIDVLGGGMVTAPPSHGPNGDYQFISGSLDDLDRLPIMRNVPERALPRPVPLAEIRQGRSAGRNDALFRFCMRIVKRCGNLDQLLGQAREYNSQLPNPLKEHEVMKATASAWGYEERGENRFGQFGAYFRFEEVIRMCQDPDAFMLLAFLRANQGPWAEFYIANGLAKTFGWGDKRLAAAREHLIEQGVVVSVRPASRHQPTLYRWDD